MKKFAFLLAAMTLVSTSALSQDAPKQTAEGAHQFLSVVSPQQGLTVEINEGHGYNRGTWSGWIAREREVSGYYVMDPFKVTEVEGVACVTTFKWHTDWTTPLHSDYGNLRTNDIMTQAYAHEMSGLKERTLLFIEWSKVAGVKRDEHGTQIEIVGYGRVTAPTVELATRVQFAMEFLRNVCDPTAGTGF